jgi:Tn3 transposase DDE domain
MATGAVSATPWNSSESGGRSITQISNPSNSIGLDLPLSNAVLVWNTIRISEIITSLEGASGQPVPVADLARVSPLHSARLLVSGRYNFDRATPPDPL